MKFDARQALRTFANIRQGQIIGQQQAQDEKLQQLLSLNQLGNQLFQQDQERQNQYRQTAATALQYITDPAQKAAALTRVLGGADVAATQQNPFGFGPLVGGINQINPALGSFLPQYTPPTPDQYYPLPPYDPNAGGGGAGVPVQPSPGQAPGGPPTGAPAPPPGGTVSPGGASLPGGASPPASTPGGGTGQPPPQQPVVGQQPIIPQAPPWMSAAQPPQPQPPAIGPPAGAIAGPAMLPPTVTPDILDQFRLAALQTAAPYLPGGHMVVQALMAQRAQAEAAQQAQVAQQQAGQEGMTPTGFGPMPTPTTAPPGEAITGFGPAPQAGAGQVGPAPTGAPPSVSAPTGAPAPAPAPGDQAASGQGQPPIRFTIPHVGTFDYSELPAGRKDIEKERLGYLQRMGQYQPKDEEDRHNFQTLLARIQRRPTTPAELADFDDAVNKAFGAGYLQGHPPAGQLASRYRDWTTFVKDRDQVLPLRNATTLMGVLPKMLKDEDAFVAQNEPLEPVLGSYRDRITQMEDYRKKRNTQAALSIAQQLKSDLTLALDPKAEDRGFDNAMKLVNLLSPNQLANHDLVASIFQANHVGHLFVDGLLLGGKAEATWEKLLTGLQHFENQPPAVQVALIEEAARYAALTGRKPPLNLSDVGTLSAKTMQAMLDKQTDFELRINAQKISAANFYERVHARLMKSLGSNGELKYAIARAKSRADKALTAWNTWRAANPTWASMMNDPKQDNMFVNQGRTIHNDAANADAEYRALIHRSGQAAPAAGGAASAGISTTTRAPVTINPVTPRRVPVPQGRPTPRQGGAVAAPRATGIGAQTVQPPPARANLPRTAQETEATIQGIMARLNVNHARAQQMLHEHKVRKQAGAGAR